MAVNQWVHAAGEGEETAGAAISTGDFDFENSLAKYYDHEAASGDLVRFKTEGVVKIVKETKANTFAVGAGVFGQTSTMTALTAAGDGRLGSCVRASTASDDHVVCQLNHVSGS